MITTIKKLLFTIKSQDTLSKLIIVNVAVFLGLAILKVFSKLFGIEFYNIEQFISISSNYRFVLVHIWTLLTYMFVHYELLHIIFNMLMLYWFGKLFLMYFTSKQLLGLYILGGISGAVFYILMFNLIPYFVHLGSSTMVGASASVTAIIFGIAFYNKNLLVKMLFIGEIKIIYIAAVLFILDFIALGGNSNPGGHVSHIGGAIIGYCFARLYLRGKDITRGINSLIDLLTNMLKKKKKMKIRYEKQATGHNYTTNTTDIDIILDKIKRSGYKSLSDKEKKQLFDASNR